MGLLFQTHRFSENVENETTHRSRMNSDELCDKFSVLKVRKPLYHSNITVAVFYSYSVKRIAISIENIVENTKRIGPNSPNS